MKYRKNILITGVAATILTLVFFLLPQNNCDDTQDPQILALIKRAETGDLQAISALYAYDKERGVEPLAEYWALQGALLGDARLRGKYVEIFKTKFGSEQQSNIMEMLKDKASMPGTVCLIAFLTDNKNQQATCQKNGQNEMKGSNLP
ncbi:hypothetical protein H8L32_00685 [Undibacterium sp. CY18W]|uniref:Uncharacterized protein n=1 Tax=Undibacterium hunanense TaxID=2762292 RepID=A0ABR6ZJF1_9BURK|nr:hypothetical protein [Undibacterium hunanense]MBC3915986.1 hypothetical protein [Undibacterium hunanense]